MEQQLREAVRRAGAAPEARAGLLAVYRELQQAIDARRPRCVASGRCCRFEAYGHRLYVTTLELAVFQADLAARPPVEQPAAAARLRVLPEAGAGAASGGGCPFQVDGLCAVHPIRPFGCRAFFCDETAEAWQNEQYERLHVRIKALHDQHGVPYFYLEWREALRLLGLGW